jgi:hypothetical protein
MIIFAKTRSRATVVLCLPNCIKQLDMKGIPFFLIVLVGVGAVYTWVVNKPDGAALPKEGFQAAVRDALQLTIPGPINGKKAADGMPVPKCGRTEGFQSNGYGCTPKVVPMSKPLTAGAEPVVKPGKLVSAPYNQVASTAPQYYRDPAMETATRERIITATQLLRGFLSFEAPLMRGLSDPTVQLPLTQAKADLPRLEQELVFMQSNPGMPSSIKVSNIMTIESNIDYLQQKYRLAVNNGVIQRPVSFHDDGIKASPIFNRVEGFQSGSTIVPEDEVPIRATLADLKDAVGRLTAEAARLSASGTNDPVLVARVSAINVVANDLRGIIAQVDSNQLLESEIPVDKSDIDQLFANIANTDVPVSNLLPPGATDGDAASRQMVKDLIDKYIGAFLKGVSFDVKLKLKYTSENEAASGDKTTVNIYPPQGLTASVNNAFNPLVGDINYNTPNSIPTNSNLWNASSGGSVMPDPYAPAPVDPFSSYPQDAGRKPSASGFDWKQRSKEICENARKRGLNPADFGCMAPGAQVSDSFSWRGYAKMLCSRLKTNYYTGIDEACGCPPETWTGWNS